MYNVSGGKSMPQWLNEKKKRSLKKDEEFRSAMVQVVYCCQDGGQARSEGDWGVFAMNLFPGATVVPDIALGAVTCCSELHIGSHTSITMLLAGISRPASER